MQLDDIVASIDTAFGGHARAPLPPDTVPSEGWQQWFDGAEFQDYLQDQVNRHIVRDYLLNAIVLGFISPRRLADFAAQLRTCEGRATLSLHMLMHSVEEVGDLPDAAGITEQLQPLRPQPNSPPHIKIVPNWE